MKLVKDIFVYTFNIIITVLAKLFLIIFFINDLIYVIFFEKERKDALIFGSINSRREEIQAICRDIRNTLKQIQIFFKKIIKLIIKHLKNCL